jgi:hypothetical protein
MHCRFLLSAISIICGTVMAAHSATVPQSIPIEQIKAIQAELLNDR